MNTPENTKTKFTRSAAFKGMMLPLLTLVMLIPSCMVQGLIAERKQTRGEAVRTIDAKWSYAQTVCPPVLALPFSPKADNEKDRSSSVEGVFYIVPEKVEINARLLPEERHYGIYKTILYRSHVGIRGVFEPLAGADLPEGTLHWDRAYLRFGVSDLRGISDNVTLEVNGKNYPARATGERDLLLNEVLRVDLRDTFPASGFAFAFELDLKGSESLNFIPVARTTEVTVGGAWTDPGFIGSYTPEYTIDTDGFRAEWKVLSFNRSIPDRWTGPAPKAAHDVSFGVTLVDTVDIYQLNIRSAKYALMFIALTFVIFFFVEVLSKKSIHPIQYTLVGIALGLFYSLLLSISEPLGFGLAYLISATATIGLITVYASTIFRNRRQTLPLAGALTLLYVFLYVILQLEGMALLAGSIGLFIALAVIMYFSRRINWYGDQI